MRPRQVSLYTIRAQYRRQTPQDPQDPQGPPIRTNVKVKVKVNMNVNVISPTCLPWFSPELEQDQICVELGNYICTFQWYIQTKSKISTTYGATMNPNPALSY